MIHHKTSHRVRNGLNLDVINDVGRDMKPKEKGIKPSYKGEKTEISRFNVLVLLILPALVWSVSFL